MAETIKVLAQSNPVAATLTNAYTVPASTSTVISSIVVCNRGAATSFRISIAVAGAANDDKQYLYYDIAITANNTFSAVLGITLAATDVVRVYATLATLSFNIFGIEVT
mgnify:CR=1 FL=1